MSSDPDATVLQALAAAFEHHRAGRRVQAKQLYRAVLEVDSANVEALHLLGVLELQEGGYEDARALLHRALQLNPEHAQALSNYGLVLMCLQRPLDALLHYDRSLALKPRQVETTCNRGNALYTLGRYEEALVSYEKALQISPTHADALSNRGNTLHHLGRHDEALTSYDAALAAHPDHVGALTGRGGLLQLRSRHMQALADFDKALLLDPNNVHALSNRGNSLQGLKLFEDALASYDKALAIAPASSEVHSNRGTVLHQLGRHDEALTSYENALRVRPHYPEAWVNRGSALQALGRFPEALISYDEALKLSPNSIEALANRGRTLCSLDRHAEALACFDSALASDPTRAEVLCARGAALQALGRHEDALVDYEKAVAVKPGYADAHVNEGLCRLLKGDFERGWQAYEWRWALDAGMRERKFEKPRWSGHEDIEGQTILLHAEQGLGDTIQFCRYVDLIARQGAKVILQVQSPLKPLLSNLSGARAVLADGDALPAFDYHCPLLSLPFVLRTRLETIPAAVPYLGAPAQALKKWEGRLRGNRLKVGIAWSGSSVDRNRSIPLNQLARLESPDITLVSLQREVEPEDRTALESETHILRLGPELEDFADTAAVVSFVDLVICIDTSVAHLAGALGKPVWILLPHVADWRWLVGRSDSPWYPTARLFRQPRPGDWRSVIHSVHEKLLAIRPDQNERPTRR